MRKPEEEELAKMCYKNTHGKNAEYIKASDIHSNCGNLGKSAGGDSILAE